MSELWAKWEGQVIDGGLPLRRLIGVSDHSAVFLTEAPAHNLPNAALKLVPAIPTLAESQLAYWNAAARLSHPRLLRLFAAGRCQLPGEQGNLHFLYVLMEYADQNLAQLLETRALTEVEARETLPPLLDGLAFLHSRNLVQGQLKPSNILVVGEQLKLASDTIRPAGEAAASISMQSVYDPPEGRDGSFSTAGDVWALGVTLYEALTRTTPARPDERSHGVVLPPDFPPGSADVIRECLSRRPSDRPSVAALQAWVSGKVRYPGAPSPPPTAAAAESGQGGVHSAAAKGAPVGAGIPVAPPGAVDAGPGSAAASAEQRDQEGAVPARPNQGRLTIRVEREPIYEEPPERRSSLPVAAAFSALVAVLIIAWGAVRLLGHHSSANPPSVNDASSPSTTQLAPHPGDPQRDVTQGSAGSPPSAVTPNPSPSVPSASEQSPARHSDTASNTTSQGSTATGTAGGSSAVVHEEVPNVPRSALATIHGHVKVAVRVTVDSSGNVIDDTLDHAGPSHYFARVASEAARKWKFAAAEQKTSRQWVVHFDFSRSGTTAHATAARSRG